jgi:hypothetical protein
MTAQRIAQFFLSLPVFRRRILLIREQAELAVGLSAPTLSGEESIPQMVTAQGFDKTNPVANNSTASGRQMNRRAEMVVAGEIIGTSITEDPASRSNQQ